MAQHKWHKEIKAWADGAEIEQRIPLSKYTNRQSWQPFTDEWIDFVYENDNKMYWEYRIKPQPFLGFKEIPYKDWVLRFYKMPNDLWYTEGINDEWMDEMVEASKPQPKDEKPKYLYVYKMMTNEGLKIQFWDSKTYRDESCIGKIPLITETEDHGD